MSYSERQIIPIEELGRRYNPNNNLLDSVIQTGISQKLLPDNFRSIIGRNTDTSVWRDSYSRAEDNGFVFAKYGEPDTDFYKSFSKRTDRQIMNKNVSIWKNKMYRSFYSQAIVSLNKVRESAPSLIPTFSKIFMYILRNKIGISEEIQKVVMQNSGLSGLSGGQIAPKDNKWVKPVAAVAIVGTVLGVGVWKKDEIMAAVSGKKSKSVNGVDGLDGTKKKGKKATSRKGKKGKGLGNAGMTKIKAIQERARKLQKESGYTMKNVKEIEFKNTKQSRPKLSWQDALKRAARELR
ncbi:hypothetical protein V9L05_01545 [Bernardetia sp. Wsw4-3y2]|uniref:hypothetical protein n=1 Tax=Bernardetia sp. Wsw4-3y2 TaxID=3127471 RepID=UPI0030CEABD7